MKEPSSFPMYDVDDDMDSTPHTIYDKYDDTCMVGLKDDKLGVDALEHDENIALDELPFEDDFISCEEENERTKFLEEILYQGNNPLD